MQKLSNNKTVLFHVQCTSSLCSFTDPNTFHFPTDCILQLLSHHLVLHTAKSRTSLSFWVKKAKWRRRHEERDRGRDKLCLCERGKTRRGWSGIAWIKSSSSLSHMELYHPVPRWNILLIQDISLLLGEMTTRRKTKRSVHPVKKDISTDIEVSSDSVFLFCVFGTRLVKIAGILVTRLFQSMFSDVLCSPYFSQTPSFPNKVID